MVQLDPARVAAKWQRRVSTAAPDYQEGISNPKRDWAQATTSAANTWKAAITEAVNSGRWEQGVAAAGTAKWQQNTIAKAGRWTEGVSTAVNEYQAKMATVLQNISAALQGLPSRGPAGSEQNINRAVEFEWIPQHKLYRKAILIKGVENKRLRYLNRDEEKRLMEAIKCPLLREIVIFALNTGLRKKEILSLKWNSVNFETKCIILEPSETKNRKRHVLPLNSRAWQIIKRRFRQRVEGCPYVFHRNGRKINSIRTAFENSLKRAGIENFHFHDLRHTFASRLVQKGVDLYVVKELLNHSDITTTQRYAHLRLDNLKKAVEKLP